MKLNIITQENERQRDCLKKIRILLKYNSQTIKFKPHCVCSFISCQHWNCFHISAVVNTAASNLSTQEFCLRTCVFTSLGFAYTYTHAYAYKQTELLGHQVTACLNFRKGPVVWVSCRMLFWKARALSLVLSAVEATITSRLEEMPSWLPKLISPHPSHAGGYEPIPCDGLGMYLLGVTVLGI